VLPNRQFEPNHPGPFDQLEQHMQDRIYSSNQTLPKERTARRLGFRSVDLAPKYASLLDKHNLKQMRFPSLWLPFCDLFLCDLYITRRLTETLLQEQDIIANIQLKNVHIHSYVQHELSQINIQVIV
jgi:hypothetical protein